MKGEPAAEHWSINEKAYPFEAGRVALADLAKNPPEITQVRATTTDEGTGEFVVTATASAQKEIDGRMVMTLGRSGVFILAVDKRLPSLEEVFRALTTGPLKASPCQ